MEEVAARARRLEVEPLTEVVRQGDPGNTFYVIETGECEVLLDGYGIGHLGPGSGFGERALLRSRPRTATVRTLVPTALYAIDRASFLSALTGQPPELIDGAGVRVERVGPDPSTRLLPEVLGEVTFLRELDSGELERLADAATIEDWEPGAVIIREGDDATAFFVLLSGGLQTTIEGRAVSELLPGDAFGEIALLHGVQRTATVTASQPSRTCRVPAESVAALVPR